MSRQPTSPSTPPPDTPPPPAYFLSLTVENYRCFGPPQTLDLSDGAGKPTPWTIILGENGVGKTTLLQCLAVLEPKWEHSGTTAQDRHFSHNTSHLQDLGLMFPFSPRNMREGTTKIVGNVHRGKISTIGISDNFSSELSIEVGPSTNWIAVGRLRSDYIGVLVCYGYGASRRMGKSTLSEQRTEDMTASLFSDDVDLINAEEWLLQADYTAKSSSENSKAAQRRDQIRDILIALLPDVEDIRFRVLEEGIGTPIVEFQTPYGWVRLKGLSLGYRTLITWMVDLASRLFDRYPDSPNPLAEPAVVLVDEIDLHLHPRWQRTLMQFLSARFPNAQFIATAHSPLVVQAAAEDANIVLLRRDGDHVVIDNDVEAIRNWRVDQILTSELFGLDSARPPQTQSLLDEREAILSKPRLTKRDQARLQELESQIGTLPTGETPQDQEAMDIIRCAAALLQPR